MQSCFVVATGMAPTSSSVSECADTGAVAFPLTPTVSVRREIGDIRDCGLRRAGVPASASARACRLATSQPPQPGTASEVSGRRANCCAHGPFRTGRPLFSVSALTACRRAVGAAGSRMSSSMFRRSRLVGCSIRWRSQIPFGAASSIGASGWRSAGDEWWWDGRWGGWGDDADREPRVACVDAGTLHGEHEDDGVRV